MFIIHSLYVHYMFTICSQDIHYIFTISSPYARERGNEQTTYTFHKFIPLEVGVYVHYTFTICSLYTRERRNRTNYLHFT